MPKIWQIFYRMHIKWCCFSKMCFHSIREAFLAKNQKSFTCVKIKKYEEETEYFEKKKRFLLKKHLYQNAKAHNMPEVAGRLV